MFSRFLALFKRQTHATPPAKPRPRWKTILLFTSTALAISIVLLLAILASCVLPYFRALDTAHLPPYHPFRSEQAKQQYLASYELRSRAWPVPSKTMTVHTSFSETYVRSSGPEDGPPVRLRSGPT